MATLQELARKFAVLKELEELHEKAAKTIGSELAKLGEELFSSFANEGTNKIELVPGIFQDHQGRVVKPELKYKPTVLDELLLFSWLRNNNAGQLIKETVHYKTLESFLTSQKENNLAIPGENIIKIFTLETANVRRVPKSK